VAVGAGVGAGCHPCVSHHLKAGAKAGLDAGRLLAAVTSAERVTAEAAVQMAGHARRKLGGDLEAALLTPLEDALAGLGAAIGANDARNIERRLRAAVGLGASRAQLQQAIEAARKVQESAMRIHLREAERLLDAAAPPAAAAAEEAEGQAAGDGCGCATAEEAATQEDRAAEAATPQAAGTPAELFASAGPGPMADCRRMLASFAGGAAPPEGEALAATGREGCA
jgi:hypothetical protein